jgi:hypothetical protein
MKLFWTRPTQIMDSCERAYEFRDSVQYGILFDCRTNYWLFNVIRSVFRLTALSYIFKSINTKLSALSYSAVTGNTNLTALS